MDGKKDLLAGLKELEEEGPFDVGEDFIKREREEEERWRSIWPRPDVSGREKERIVREEEEAPARGGAPAGDSPAGHGWVKKAAGWGQHGGGSSASSSALGRVEGRLFYFLFSPFSVFRFSKVLGGSRLFYSWVVVGQALYRSGVVEV